MLWETVSLGSWETQVASSWMWAGRVASHPQFSVIFGRRVITCADSHIICIVTLKSVILKDVDTSPVVVWQLIHWKQILRYCPPKVWRNRFCTSLKIATNSLLATAWTASLSEGTMNYGRIPVLMTISLGWLTEHQLHWSVDYFSNVLARILQWWPQNPRHQQVRFSVVTGKISSVKQSD